MSNSTSTARMKKLRVAHYIAVEGSSGRSNRTQSEAPLKKLKAENARHAVRSVCFHRGRGLSRCRFTGVVRQSSVGGAVDLSLPILNRTTTPGARLRALIRLLPVPVKT